MTSGATYEAALPYLFGRSPTREQRQRLALINQMVLTLKPKSPGK
jgi:hypothetical protein